MTGYKIESGSSVVRRGDLLWRRTATDVLVLEPGSSRLVVLAGTAVELWDLLAVPRDTGQLVAELATRHGESADAIAGDVGVALRDLMTRSLVEAVA